MKHTTKSKVKAVLASLSLLTTASLSVPTAEAKKVTIADVQRACERALAANTASALQSFLIKYPPSSLYRNQIACYALAQAPAANGDNDEHPGTDKPNRGPDPFSFPMSALAAA